MGEFPLWWIDLFRNTMAGVRLALMDGTQARVGNIGVLGY